MQFYIRSKQQHDVLKLVSILLKENDIRKTVLTLLKSCDLSTDYVDKIPQERKSNINIFEINYRNMSKLDPIFGPIVMQNVMNEEKENLTLDKWLKENHLVALKKSELSRPIRQDVLKLKKTLIDKLGVSEIVWDCGWNEMHFRGCLQSFIALADQNSESMHILKGKYLCLGY